MAPLFEKYVNRVLDFVRLNLHPVMYNEQVRWGRTATDPTSNDIVMQFNLMPGNGRLPPPPALTR